MTADLQKLASTLPDEQVLLDTRGSLLSRPCEIFGQTNEGFVIRRFDTPLICVIGKPAISAIKEAVSKSVEEVEVLTCRESVTHIDSALSDWQRESAVIHELSNPADMNEEMVGRVRLAGENELSGLWMSFLSLLMNF